MKKYCWLVLSLIFFACSHAKYKNPHVLIATAYGDVEVELFSGKSPKTVAAFLSYVDAGLYKNSSFYRVQTNENVPPENNAGLIQGGIYKTNPNKLSQLPGILHEPTKLSGLLHVDGTISLARTTPGTASTEFFICIGDQPQFDYNANASGDGQGFAAFGTVVNGMEVIRKIQNTPSHGDAFDTQIKITNIERL